MISVSVSRSGKGNVNLMGRNTYTKDVSFHKLLPTLLKKSSEKMSGTKNQESVEVIDCNHSLQWFLHINKILDFDFRRPCKNLYSCEKSSSYIQVFWFWEKGMGAMMWQVVRILHMSFLVWVYLFIYLM